MNNLTLETFKTEIFDFENNQDWKYLGNKPTILKFTASWCQPCKQIQPILDELDNEYDNINFYKIDVEEEQELSAMFGIKSVPSLLFIPVDEKPQMMVGGVSKDKFKEVIKDIFNM
ncbi:thioredoxin family protein [Trichloromonas sp.]|uniref:thioredoxin family protein n=1 Tax=Trichloromonas sp. TaxID=3069249 RepID=UPI002A4128A7|nr:thioredoxin family protein [Trichloromonas sp.]